jgi:geranylgeranyl diphosphate synthase type II
MELKPYLRARQTLVDKALNQYLPSASARPPTIHKAMRYSLFAGGKRLRPILCLAAAEACGGDPKTAVPFACAVECIHTYSLIHDDLPCMDDDDFRRGKPTSHKVFGDAVAVLAGDALLTVAFEILAHGRETRRYPMRTYISELASASGSRRLIAGQVVDLESEGKKVTARELRFIHESKTAALLTSAIRLGGMSADATPSHLDRLTKFGHALGLAFQVIDDILDVTQSTEKLGKSAGKDLASEKATYPSIIGLDRSRAEAARLTETALESVSGFGSRGEPLRALASHLLARDF